MYMGAVMREELQCDRETDNPHNSYAVVCKRRQIVGHIPCSVSADPWDDQVHFLRS